LFDQKKKARDSAKKVSGNENYTCSPGEKGPMTGKGSKGGKKKKHGKGNSHRGKGIIQRHQKKKSSPLKQNGPHHYTTKKRGKTGSCPK